MKYDIFISYSRADLEIVNTFVSKLESAGYKVWIDKVGVNTGTRFKEVLVHAIEDSKVFLFFSSKDSNVSPWTAKEIGIAVRRKKTIIPIKIDNANYNPEVEFDLVNLDSINYTDKSKREEEFSKLMRTLGTILPPTPPPPPSPDEPIIKPDEPIIKKIIKKLLLLTKRHGYTIAFSLITFIAAIISIFLFYFAKTNEHNSDVLSSSYGVDNTQLIMDDTQLIDLGLPSGTLWADRNLGAQSPEVYGLHFAWGETKPKEEYSVESYSYEYISDEGDRTKKPRIKLDNASNLVSEYDAATVRLGSSFRMPTSADMLELIRFCTWKKEGLLYRVTGPNNNSIYLPLVYHIEGRKSYDSFYYWTSTKITNKAYVLEIDTINGRITVDAYPPVFIGCPIRPVSNLKKQP